MGDVKIAVTVSLDIQRSLRFRRFLRFFDYAAAPIKRLKTAYSRLLGTKGFGAERAVKAERK
jgi:hypothetical protein